MRHLRICKAWPAALAAMLLSTGESWACKVCYGAAESPVLEGMSASIVFMLAMTYLLIVGLGVTFFVVRRRSIRLQPAAAAKGEGA